MSHHTVGEAREELKTIGQIAQSDRVLRRGGGTYPARKPRKPRKSKTEKAVDPVVDSDGFDAVKSGSDAESFRKAVDQGIELGIAQALDAQ